MSDDTRARARAQYFGPEMLRVIDETLGRIDHAIRTARSMEPPELIALLLEIRAPLHDVATQAKDVDGDQGAGGGAL